MYTSIIQISGQCLTAAEDGSGNVFMQSCDSTLKTQQWVWQNVNKELLEERQTAETLEKD